MKTSILTLCITLFLAALLSSRRLQVVAEDGGGAADCLSDCLTTGASLLCSCDDLGASLSLFKRGGAFPFRYGKRGLVEDKRQMPFRYGKRQFRYGKRQAAVAPADLFGYNRRSASAYNHLSSLAEEK